MKVLQLVGKILKNSAPSVTTGGNTAVGFEAGYTMTTGYRNTVLGHKAGSGDHSRSK